MADVEEAPRFSVSFCVVNVIFKRFYVDLSENARIAINHGLFVFKHLLDHSEGV